MGAATRAYLCGSGQVVLCLGQRGIFTVRTLCSFRVTVDAAGMSLVIQLSAVSLSSYREWVTAAIEAQGR